MEDDCTKGPDVCFENVGLELSGVRLLNGISLRIPRGTLHCLVGPNGAGKTSLLRCLLGQASHTGRVELNWPQRVGAIGYVPQTLDFDRTLPITVEDFMTLISQATPAFAGLRAVHRSAVASALAAVGLAEKRHRALGKLSGGELKRLLLAQALSPNPSLLVLDEPMNHLDASGVALVRSLLKELRGGGTTIVCCHHDLAQVRTLADSVTALQAGSVLFSGPPSDVLTPENILRAFAGVDASAA